MTIPPRLGNRTEVQPAGGATLREYLLPAQKRQDFEGRRKVPTFELAFRIFAVFRAHPHINNVLTHISRANWIEVEKSLNRILDLSTTTDGLSPLEENIIELMVSERGITGKILKPYFQAGLHRILEPSPAERLISHINALYLELEWKVQHPPLSAAPEWNSKEPGHAGREPQ